MSTKSEKLLNLTADMQRFAAGEDKLDSMIRSYTEGELSEDDLFLVNAAAAKPDYQSFLAQARNRKL